MMIIVLAAALQAEPDRLRAVEPVSFGFQARLWLGYEGNTRMRSMEQEGIGKGGTGRGTLFQYEDVGHDSVTWIPDLRADMRFGPHEIWARGSYSARTVETHLREALEFDGDLLASGDRFNIRFQIATLELGYSYRIASGALEARLGAAAMYWNWKASFRSVDGTETSDEVIPTILMPVPTLSLRLALGDGVALKSETAFLYGLGLRRGVSLGSNSEGVIRQEIELEADLGALTLRLGVGTMVQDSVSFEHRDEADLLNYRRVGAYLGLEVRF